MAARRHDPPPAPHEEHDDAKDTTTVYGFLKNKKKNLRVVVSSCRREDRRPIVSPVHSYRRSVAAEGGRVSTDTTIINTPAITVIGTTGIKPHHARAPGTCEL